jgi:lysozyme family protein
MNAADPASVARPEGWTADHEQRWAAIYARLLKTEGGYVNNPKDPGGATKYGISLRFLVIKGLIDGNRDGFADFDLNRDGRIDALDIKLLTPANAEALYLKLFYIETGFWSLPRPLDAAMFDFGVNAGTATAVRLMQKAINTLINEPLKADGLLGPNTRRAIVLATKAGPLLTRFREQVTAHYRYLVANNGELQQFLAGWLNRVKELGRVG